MTRAGTSPPTNKSYRGKPIDAVKSRRNAQIAYDKVKKSPMRFFTLDYIFTFLAAFVPGVTALVARYYSDGGGSGEAHTTLQFLKEFGASIGPVVMLIIVNIFHYTYKKRYYRFVPIEALLLGNFASLVAIAATAHYEHDYFGSDVPMAVKGIVGATYAIVGLAIIWLIVFIIRR